MKIILLLYAFCVHLILSQPSINEYKDAFRHDPEIGERLVDVCLNPSKALSSNCQKSVSTEAKLEEMFPVLTCYVNPNPYYRDCDKALDSILDKHPDRPAVLSKAYSDTCDINEATCDMLWEKISGDVPRMMVPVYDTLCLPSPEARTTKKCKNILDYAEQQGPGSDLRLKDFFEKVKDENVLDKLGDKFDATNIGAVADVYRTNCGGTPKTTEKKDFCEKFGEKILRTTTTSENVNKILEAVCLDSSPCTNLKEVILGSTRADEVFLFSCDMDKSPEAYPTDTKRQKTCENFFTHCTTSSATGCATVKKQQKMAEALDALDKPKALNEKLQELCKVETAKTLAAQVKESDKSPCSKILKLVLKRETSENINKILEAVCVDTAACTALKEVFLGSSRADEVFLFSCDMDKTPESYPAQQKRQKTCKNFFTHCATSSAKGCKTVKKHQKMAEALEVLDKPAVLKDKLQELCKSETAKTIAAQENRNDKSQCSKILNVIMKKETSENINKILEAVCVDSSSCSPLEEVILGSTRADEVFLFSCNMDKTPETYPTDSKRQKTCKNFFTHCATSSARGCVTVKEHQKMAEALEVLDNPAVLKNNLQELCKSESAKTIAEQEKKSDKSQCSKILNLIVKEKTSENINKILEAVCVDSAACAALKEVILRSPRVDEVFLLSCDMNKTPETYPADIERQKTCKNFFTHCATSSAKGCTTVKKQQKMAEALEVLDKPAVLKNKLQELCKDESAWSIAAQQKKSDKSQCFKILNVIVKKETSKDINEILEAVCVDSSTCAALKEVILGNPRADEVFLLSCDMDKTPETYPTDSKRQKTCKNFFTHCTTSTATGCATVKKQQKMANALEVLDKPAVLKKNLQELCKGETAKTIAEQEKKSDKSQCSKILNVIMKKETPEHINKILEAVCVDSPTCIVLKEVILGSSRADEVFLFSCNMDKISETYPTDKNRQQTCKNFFTHCAASSPKGCATVKKQQKMAEALESLDNSAVLKKKLQELCKDETTGTITDQANKKDKTQCSRILNVIAKNTDQSTNVFVEVCSAAPPPRTFDLCSVLRQGIYINKIPYKNVFEKLCKSERERETYMCQTFRKMCASSTYDVCIPIRKQFDVDNMKKTVFKPFDSNKIAELYKKLCDGTSEKFCAQINSLLKAETDTEFTGYADVVRTVCTTPDTVACERITKETLGDPKGYDRFSGVCDVTGTYKYAECNVFFEYCASKKTDDEKTICEEQIAEDKEHLKNRKNLDARDLTKAATILHEICETLTEKFPKNCERAMEHSTKYKTFLVQAYQATCDKYTEVLCLRIWRNMIKLETNHDLIDQTYSTMCTQKTDRQATKCQVPITWCATKEQTVPRCLPIVRQQEVDDMEKSFRPLAIDTVAKLYAKLCDGKTSNFCEELSGRLMKHKNYNEISNVALGVCKVQKVESACDHIVKAILMSEKSGEIYKGACDVEKKTAEFVLDTSEGQKRLTDCEIFFGGCKTSESNKYPGCPRAKKDKIFLEYVRAIKDHDAKKTAEQLEKACMEKDLVNCDRLYRMIVPEKDWSKNSYVVSCDTGKKTCDDKNQFLEKIAVGGSFEWIFTDVCSKSVPLRKTKKCSRFNEWCKIEGSGSKHAALCVKIMRRFEADGAAAETVFNPSVFAERYSRFCDGSTEEVCKESNGKLKDTSLPHLATTTLAVCGDAASPGCQRILKETLLLNNAYQRFVEMCAVTKSHDDKDCKLFFDFCEKSANELIPKGKETCTKEIKEDQVHTEHLKKLNLKSGPKEAAKILQEACKDEAARFKNNCQRALDVVAADKQISVQTYKENCDTYPKDGSCKKQWETMTRIETQFHLTEPFEHLCTDKKERSKGKCKNIHVWCSKDATNKAIKSCIHINRQYEVDGMETSFNPFDKQKVVGLFKTLCDGKSTGFCDEVSKRVMETRVTKEHVSDVTTTLCATPAPYGPCDAIMKAVLSDEQRSNEVFLVSCDVDIEPRQYHTTGKQKTNCDMYFTICKSSVLFGCARVKEDDKYTVLLKDYDETDATKTSTTLSKACDGTGDNCKRILDLITSNEKKEFTYNVYIEVCADDGNTCRRMFQDFKEISGFVEYIAEKGCNSGDDVRTGKCKTINDWCNTVNNEPRCLYITRATKVVYLSPKRLADNLKGAQEVADIGKAVCDGASEKVCTAFLEKVFRDKKPAFLAQFHQMNALTCSEPSSKACRRYMGGMLKTANHKERYHAVCNVEGDLPLGNCKVFFDYCGVNPTLPNCAQILVDSKYGEAMKNVDTNAGSDVPLGKAVYTLCTDGMDSQNCKRVLTAVEEKKFVQNPGAVFKSACDDASFCEKLWNEKISPLKSVKDFNTEACATEDDRKKNYCQAILKWCQTSTDADCPAVTASFDLDNIDSFFDLFKPERVVDIYRKLCVEESERCTDLNGKVMKKIDQIKKFLSVVCLQHTENICQRFVQEIIKAEDAVFNDVYNSECASVKLKGEKNQMCYPFFTFCSTVENSEEPRCDKIKKDDAEVAKLIAVASNPRGTAFFLHTACAKPDEAECDTRMEEILNLEDGAFINVFDEVCAYKEECGSVADKKFKEEITKSVKMITTKCVNDQGEPMKSAPKYCKPMQTWCEENGPTHGNAETKTECENHVNIYRFASLSGILRPSVDITKFVKYYRGFCDPPKFEKMCTDTTTEVKTLSDHVVSELVLNVCEGFPASSEADFNGLPTSCQKIIKASIEKSGKGFKEVCDVESGWDDYKRDRCNLFFFACPLSSAAPGSCETILADRALDEVVQKASKDDDEKTAAAASGLCSKTDDQSINNCGRFLELFVFQTNKNFISAVLSGVCKTDAESCTIMTRTLAASSQKSFSEVYDKLCSVETERTKPHCQVFKEVCAVSENKASVQEKCDFISKQFEMDEKMTQYFAIPFGEDQQKTLVAFYTRMCDGTTEEFCKTVTRRLMSTKEEEESTKTSRLSQSPTIITEVCEATETANENTGCAKILEAALTANDQIEDIYKKVCRVQQQGQRQECQNFYGACERNPNLYGCTQIVNEDIKLLEFIKGINKTDDSESVNTIVRASSDTNNYPRFIAYLMDDLDDQIFVTTLAKTCFTDSQPITVCRRIMEAAHKRFESFAKTVATTAFCLDAQNSEAGFCTTMSSICSTEQSTDRCYEVHKKECKGLHVDKNPQCEKHIRFYCLETKPLQPCTDFILGTQEYYSVAEELGEACSTSTVVVPGRCEAFYQMVIPKTGDVLAKCAVESPTGYCKKMWTACQEAQANCPMFEDAKSCAVSENGVNSALRCERMIDNYCTRSPQFFGSDACVRLEDAVSDKTSEMLAKLSTQCSKPIVNHLAYYCEIVAEHFRKDNKGEKVFKKDCNQGVLFGTVTICKVLRHTCELPKLKDKELCKKVDQGVQIYETYNRLNKKDLSAVVVYLTNFCEAKTDGECEMAEKHLASDNIDYDIFVQACDENKESTCDRYFKNKVATGPDANKAVLAQFQRLCTVDQLQTLKCTKMRDWCSNSHAPSEECTQITREYQVSVMEQKIFAKFEVIEFTKFYKEICADGVTPELCAKVDARVLSGKMEASSFVDILSYTCKDEETCKQLSKAILNSERSAEIFVANCNVDTRVETNCELFTEQCATLKPIPPGCDKVKEDMKYQDWRDRVMLPELPVESAAAIRDACHNGEQIDARNCDRLHKLVLENEPYTLSMADILCYESTDEAICAKLLKGSLNQHIEVINQLSRTNCTEERKSVICKTIDRLCVTGHQSKCYQFHNDKCADPESEKLVCFNIFNYYCGNDYLPTSEVTNSDPTLPKVETREDLCWKFIQSMTNTDHKKGAFAEKCEAESVPCTKVVELDYNRGTKDLLKQLFSRKCNAKIDPIMCSMTMKLCKDAVKTPQCLVIEKPTCVQGSFEQCKPVLDRHCRPLNEATCSQMVEYAESNVEKTGQVLHYHCNTAYDEKLCSISMEKAKTADLLANTFNASCGQPEKLRIEECQRVNTFCNTDSSSQCELIRKQIDNLEIEDSETCQKGDAICEEKVQKFCVDDPSPVCDILYQKMPKEVLFHFYKHCVDEKGSGVLCERTKTIIKERGAVAELFAARCPGLGLMTRKCKDIRDFCEDKNGGDCSAVKRGYTILLAAGIAGLVIGLVVVLAGVLLYLYKTRKAAEALKETKQREKSMYLDSMMQ